MSLNICKNLAKKQTEHTCLKIKVILELYDHDDEV